MTLQEFIKPFLANANTTQKELAEYCGISQEFLSRIMNGHNTATAQQAHDIGVRLKLSDEDYYKLQVIVARTHGFAV